MLKRNYVFTDNGCEIAEKPEFAMQRAVVGMLPKGPLGRKMAKKLKVYAGPDYEQVSQKPEKIELDRTAPGGKE